MVRTAEPPRQVCCLRVRARPPDRVNVVAVMHEPEQLVIRGRRGPDAQAGQDPNGGGEARTTGWSGTSGGGGSVMVRSSRRGANGCPAPKSYAKKASSQTANADLLTQPPQVRPPGGGRGPTCRCSVLACDMTEPSVPLTRS